MARFILDLDGTLVDSVYQHVLAWHVALQSCGYDLPMWQIHRKIGMSGGLLIRALSSELGVPIDEAAKKRLEYRHSEEFARLRDGVAPFPGARELLQTLRRAKVPFAIATSGDRSDVEPLLRLVDAHENVPVTFKDDAPLPKPDPGLLLAAAAKLPQATEETMVLGDSVWDMLAARRAHFLGIGLLTGGYGESELSAAGAYRVYADPAQMLAHLHEIGVVTEATWNGNATATKT
ncbi:MAG TPA: HAD family hydrolase [Candidatus Baltobacteraceae bacterium]|nr:HAD family hydrolase [Candidatus Baltobacteraceae bacterium]